MIESSFRKQGQAPGQLALCGSKIDAATKSIWLRCLSFNLPLRHVSRTMNFIHFIIGPRQKLKIDAQKAKGPSGK